MSWERSMPARPTHRHKPHSSFHTAQCFSALSVCLSPNRLAAPQLGSKFESHPLWTIPPFERKRGVFLMADFCFPFSAWQTPTLLPGHPKPLFHSHLPGTSRLAPVGSLSSRATHPSGTQASGSGGLAHPAASVGRTTPRGGPETRAGAPQTRTWATEAEPWAGGGNRPPAPSARPGRT